MFRLNLTLIEGDFNLDRNFYGGKLKPLSFPHGKNEVRKLEEQLGLFSIKNLKKSFSSPSNLERGFFKKKLKVKLSEDNWLIFLESIEKTLR